MNSVPREERMQRIRIGLTGLAFVFLLVLLGTAISNSSDETGPPPVQNELAEPSEPLAEIGAAPGMTTSENESGEAATANHQ